MEKEMNLNVEQPCGEISAKVEATNAELSENMSAQEIPAGSTKSKFKDVAALISAYENLQAEFTKKCQKLSELEKRICDNACHGANEGNAPQNAQIVPPQSKSDEEAQSLPTEKVASQKENAISAKTLFEDEDLRRQVLQLYIKELANRKIPPLLSSEPGGASAKATTTLPTTLGEAGEVAKKFFA